jgi:Fe-S cluster assembly ATP-binding protein
MSELVVRDVHAGTPDGFEILRGVDLEVRSGEVHALMGPNGSGKSTLAHVLMGRGDYVVTRGSVTLDGVELLGMPTWQRAVHGLFLAMQYPVEVPGVPVRDLLGAAARAHAYGDDVAVLDGHVHDESRRLDVPDELLRRGVNDGFSGGEKKRMETLQLAVLKPKVAILDEIDSGLDVDALRDVSRRIEAMTSEDDLGVLAITHYARLLTELRPDRVHILLGGRVVQSGGPDLADELERTGYEGIAAELGVEELAVEKPVEADPFAEPGF